MVLDLTGLHFSKLNANLDASSRLGTTITAGATAHTKGSWTEIPIGVSSTPFAFTEYYALWIRARNVAASAAVRNYLLDLAVSSAGGAERLIVVPNLSVSAAGGAGTEGILYLLPLYMSNSTALYARGQSNVASQTCALAVSAIALTPFVNEEDAPGFWTAYGVNLATTNGVSVTGGSGAYGPWTEIVASTARAHTWWTFGLTMLSDTTLNNWDMLVQLGVGPSGSEQNFAGFTAHENTAEVMAYPGMPKVTRYRIPAGSRISARIAAGGTEARGVIVYAA